MLRRKRIVAGILAAGMTFAMAGCGKKDEGKTEEKDSVSTSGTVTEETVSAKTWFGFFHHAIETDDNIEHYTVDTIEQNS